MPVINSRTRVMRQGRTCLLRVIAGFWLIGLISLGARAHELNPAIVNLTLGNDGRAGMSVALNLEALVAGIGPEHDTTEAAPQAGRYDVLRGLPPGDLAAAFAGFEPALLAGIALAADDVPLALRRTGLAIPDVGDPAAARRSEIAYEAAVPAGSRVLTLRYDPAFGPVILRVTRPGGETPFFANLLAPGEAITIELAPGATAATGWETFLRYVRLGFDHILPKGLDHVLFVIGLFLLSSRLKPLLVQVTSFTLAHTVTLALGLLGWIDIPGSIVEPLIALSIVFVATENLFTQDLHRWRTAIVFGFGLLHGLGFAGVLRELMVGDGQFLASLVGFNIGVELGQVFVVLLCYAAVGYWFGARSWYHARIVVPCSLVIALVAGYWFFERVGVIA